MNSEADNPWKNARPKFKNRQSTVSGESTTSSNRSASYGNKDQPTELSPPLSRGPRDPRKRSGNRPQSASTVQQNSDADHHQLNIAALDEEAKVEVISSGRLLAWKALQICEYTDRFLQEIFADLDDAHRLSTSERAAAVDIASGIVRRRRTIDAILRSQISRPRHQVENHVSRVLQLGVYQLVFGRTPDHAAVDSTVGLCRLLDRERWTKFVNGVLRGVGRLLTPDVFDHVTPDSVPLQGGQWRKLVKPVLADRDVQFAEWLAEAFSLPDALANRWAARLSSDDAISAGFHSLESPRITLRVNKLRAQISEVHQQLTNHGCLVHAALQPNSLALIGGSRIERLPGFSEGFWSVQDESAMGAAQLLNPKSGERILDMCSAPGGKTCHAAELSDDNASIIACDVSESRLDRVRENADRLRLQSISTCLVTRDGDGIPDGPFDAVLVDVPCSNTGVLGRRPEARWRFNERELQDLVPLQTRLLIQACERIRPGGRVVYSTCSIEPEENRGVVEAVLRAFPGIKLAQEQFFQPGKPSDGAYQALLVQQDVQ